MCIWSSIDGFVNSSREGGTDRRRKGALAEDRREYIAHYDKHKYKSSLGSRHVNHALVIATVTEVEKLLVGNVN